MSPSETEPTSAQPAPTGKPVHGLSPAVACLIMAGNALGLKVNPLMLSSGKGDFADETGLQLAAGELGLEIKGLTLNEQKLRELRQPIVVATLQGSAAEVVVRQEGGVLVVASPGQPPKRVALEAFFANYQARGYLVKKRFGSNIDLTDNPKSFGFAWLLSAFWRFRPVLKDIFLAQFVVQIFLLTSPLLTQIVIDKVLMHRNTSTMMVLGVGMLIVISFELILNLLERQLSAHTVSRLDAVLGGSLVKHLFRLPLDYFDRRSVGDSVARVRELESVRGFIAGSAMQTLIELVFLVLVLVVMLYISTPLTLLVLGMIPLYALLAFVTRPLLKERLNQKYDASSASQSFMVETLSGMQTVKALGLETISIKKWDELLARYLNTSYRLGTLSGRASAISQAIQRLMILLVLWMGATLAMDNRMTIGQLIAFQMLTMRLVNPLVKLIDLWHDFQQIGVSVQRIADIFTVKPESSGPAMPTETRRMRGELQFKDVTFRYAGMPEPALSGLNFHVKPGEFVAVTGRSGSGKSTIAKLVQQMYVAESGSILIDGADVLKWDLRALRLQMGTVPQESILFSGTILENIAARQPDSPLQLIERAAQLADAHEFILRLPQGYSTVIGEQGKSLSGGQRQRIALARALFLNPQILILDEATSALDIPSEKRVLLNIRKAAGDRTTVMVTHRKSSMQLADRVVYLEGGRLVGNGPFNDIYHSMPSFRAMVDEGAVN